MNRPLVSIWLVAIVLAAVGFGIAYRFVEPAPPERVVLATGGVAGAYHAYGLALASALQGSGVSLDLRNTAGSRENLELLASGQVDVALVQGGLTPTPGAGGDAIRALASLYYEPIWIFHRLDPAPRVLTELPPDARFNRGAAGSGTRELAAQILALNGLDGSRWPELGDADAAAALERGELDGVFLVAGESAPYVQRLLRNPDIRLLDLARAQAYPLHRAYLSDLYLPRGGVDLGEDIPPGDVAMLGVTAMLAARDDLHPALIDLLILRSRDLVDGGGLFHAPGTFPSGEFVSLPLHEEAERFLSRGPSFLQRVLPFWAATLIDRMVVLLLPLLALVVPLARVFPPVYRWRVRSRIYRWYDDLRTIEARVDAGEIEAPGRDIERLVTEVRQVEAPLSYTDELYHLRQHIELVRNRIARLAAEETT